ncbi:MAG: hypothetical protein M1610_05960 [Nitrospirae bacterium]|jgi:hypothetical protein|nr:hypothetical protein [Nitrospirota bacterium]MDA8215242.1 hypothetical protein [Nitrospiraceae bacterium]MDA8339102.1 hypothetical protein [Nitrospiraceae bacterium]
MLRWIFTFVFLGIISSGVYAEDNTEKGITPYGDYCPLCGAYGYCKKQPTQKEVVDALDSYYAKKGMKAIIIKQDGRFIEAEVYKNREVVDRILLDSKTGRMRSIY